jgi:DNA-binding CsgD family transcriptional regulator
MSLQGGALPPAGRVLPTCPYHPGSCVRAYRTVGPEGPGVYPQCYLGPGRAHLLRWPVDTPGVEDTHGLSASERDVLVDAGDGLTVIESAARRKKSIETVKTQRRQVLLKLEARNMPHAVSLAVRGGVIPAAQSAPW